MSIPVPKNNEVSITDLWCIFCCCDVLCVETAGSGVAMTTGMDHPLKKKMTMTNRKRSCGVARAENC